MNKFLVETVEKKFNLKVFEDQIGESSLGEVEEDTGGKNYFIYETGGYSRSQNRKELKQIVLLRFYSEKRDDLDEISLDIIELLEDGPYEFQYSNKSSYQLGKEDDYVDEIEFYFLRRLMHGC